MEMYNKQNSMQKKVNTLHMYFKELKKKEWGTKKKTSKNKSM